MLIVQKPLVRFGQYALVQEGTVLHQMVKPDEQAVVQCGHLRISVPKPDLPVHELFGEAEAEPYAIAVTLGPPWSLLDDIVRGEPDAKLHLITWLRAAIRDRLVGAGAYYRPGVMGFAKGDPRVPEGEVWIGTQNVSLRFRKGVAVRYPVESPHSCKPVVVHAVPGTGIWINDRTLVEDMEGDSDGDLLMVIATEAGLPEQRELPAEPPVDFSTTLTPAEAQPRSRIEIARGHKAREAIGLMTWQVWVRARVLADTIPVYDAWAESYDRYTDAMEASMDGRKTGQIVTPDEFGLLDGISVPTVVLHGVNNMVRSRWRSPIVLTQPPRELLRQYWSGKYSGIKPIQVEGGQQP